MVASRTREEQMENTEIITFDASRNFQLCGRRRRNLVHML